MTDKSPHVLAYAVDLNQVKAVEITASACKEYLLCRSEELLDGFDLLQRELNTPSALCKKELPQLERFASEWGRRLLPGSWLSDPPATSIVSIQVPRICAALGDGWLRFGGGRGVAVLAGVACGMIVGCDRVAAAGGSA